MMSALSRKGRSRSKRDLKTQPRPTIQDDSVPREPFVNHGLARWNEERRQWTAKRPGVTPKRAPRVSPEQRAADTQDLYMALLTPNHQPLPKQVPLSELIGVLQDVRDLVD